MSYAASVDFVPLTTDVGGTIRVGGTRVSLDSIVYAFQEGLTAEEIVHQYPSLDLGDTYAAIGYYLHHRSEIDAYLAERERTADGFRREIRSPENQDEFRRRLLARRRAE